MKAFFSKIPLALSSLLLALFSLSNQISQYALFSQGIWCLASIGLVLILGRLWLGKDQTKEDLKNTVIASSFPSFFMALFLFFTRLPISLTGQTALWLCLLLVYLAYIIFFSYRFLRSFKLEDVYPSWFVVYVGPAISLVTAPSTISNTFKATILGLTGLAAGLLFILIFYRLFRIKVSPGLQASLAVLAAPLALLITAYLKSGQEINSLLLVGLLLPSQVFYFYSLGLFTRVVNKGFVPLFAAFSFPLVNSANAFKAATTSLKLVNLASQLIYTIELLLVLAIMVYLLYHFLKLIYYALIQAKC